MTAKRARELLNEAKGDVDAAWDSANEGWRNSAHLYLFSAITEAIMALTEAVLDADPKDEEKLLEKLRIEGRR